MSRMGRIADWLSHDWAPTWLWRAWMELWFLCVRVRNPGRRVEHCDGCYDPRLVLEMELTKLNDGSVVYTCQLCTDLAALVREAAERKGFI